MEENFLVPHRVLCPSYQGFRIYRETLSRFSCAASAWFKEANEKGITITIVSNNNESRVASFSQHLDIDFIFKARKPMGKAFDKAITKMNIRPDQTVVIGDQMLTDVFGGNRRGLYTIMVVPVKRTDGFITKFNRLIERRLLRHFSKKGYITWEEN
ncbi:YqeG family HAD IIIA-type phosphatase [Staphylococcus aureus]